MSGNKYSPEQFTMPAAALEFGEMENAQDITDWGEPSLADNQDEHFMPISDDEHREAIGSDDFEAIALQQRREALYQKMRLLALKLANRAGPNLERDDAEQVAMLALWKAILAHDPGKSTNTTFFQTSIQGSLRNAARKPLTGLSNPPRPKPARTHWITQAELAIRSRNEEVTAQTLAKESGLSIADVEAELLHRANRHKNQPTASTQFNSDDEIELPDPMSFAAYDSVINSNAFNKLIAELTTERYKIVVWLRYYEGLSQAEAGRRLGLSATSIMNAEHKALAELRAMLYKES